MTTTRAADVARRLGRHEGGGVEAYGRAVCAAVARMVPHDYACFATADPATGMITGVVKVPDGDARDAELAVLEYAVEDVNQFLDIARRRTPVGVLGIDTGGAPERCARFAEFLHPGFGFGHELRIVFRSGGAVWGGLGLYRSTGPRGFDAGDAARLGELSGPVAAGIRRSLLAGASRHRPVDGPAVLVLDAAAAVVQSTPAADRIVRDLGGDAVPMPLLTLAAAARAVAAGRTDLVPRARLRLVDGGWASAHAVCVPARGGTGSEVVLTVEEARPPEIVPLVVAALGLTRREQEVVALVLQGADTAAVADRLHLSPYTVQDHLGSVFAKAGVSKRRELTARIFFDHYAPRMGNPLGTDGWFAGPSAAAAQP